MNGRSHGSVLRLIPVSVVGSYPQPDWLIDRTRLSKGVPRVRMSELWRVQPEWLEQAQNDATLLAIRDLERLGLDVITDGEIRRESYSNHFIVALEGIDGANPAMIHDHLDRPSVVPRVVAPLRRREPVELDGLRFLREHTDLPVKVTLPGPFTLAQQAKDEHYGDLETLTMAFADVVNEEARAVSDAGADFVQLDEPWLRNDPDSARNFAVAAINRALNGVRSETIVHLCFGYGALVPGQKPTGYSFLPELAACQAGSISIEAAQPKLDLGVLASLSDKNVLLGVLDLSRLDVETPDEVAGRLRSAFQYTSPQKIVAAPDCGMKYLPRAIAYGKLAALVEGARIVRDELTGE